MTWCAEQEWNVNLTSVHQHKHSWYKLHSNVHFLSLQKEREIPVMIVTKMMMMMMMMTMEMITMTNNENNYVNPGSNNIYVRFHILYNIFNS